MEKLSELFWLWSIYLLILHLKRCYGRLTGSNDTNLEKKEKKKKKVNHIESINDLWNYLNQMWSFWACWSTDPWNNFCLQILYLLGCLFVWWVGAFFRLSFQYTGNNLEHFFYPDTYWSKSWIQYLLSQYFALLVLCFYWVVWSWIYNFFHVISYLSDLSHVMLWGTRSLVFMFVFL